MNLKEQLLEFGIIEHGLVKLKNGEESNYFVNIKNTLLNDANVNCVVGDRLGGSLMVACAMAFCPWLDGVIIRNNEKIVGSFIIEL